MNLKPHNEGYHINMSLHLHYLVDKKCNSLLESLWFLFSLWFHPTRRSWTLFILAWFDHTWYETHWNSMIERTKTLISVDFQSILKALGRTLLKHLEKRALKNTREGFTNDYPYMWMTNESSILKPKRID